MTIYFITATNRPSGGTKVINQFVNLCIEKKIPSYVVVDEDKTEPARFLSEPAPVITLKDFENKCKPGDIAIATWQSRNIHNVVLKSCAEVKVFWHHGTAIPQYPDFNGELIYTSKTYDQYWNVSHACAEFIKQRYNIPNISILPPFFDDSTLISVKNRYKSYPRNGLLVLRRRGQEIIPFILNRFPNIRVTVFEEVFDDKSIYEALATHKFFVSTDNGVGPDKLYPKAILDQSRSLLRKMMNFKGKLLNHSHKNTNQNRNGWVTGTTHLLGFPMTACEAAWLGTTVIGFPMGGGLEWMENKTCFMAKDGDADDMLDKIEAAHNATFTDLETMNANAYKKVQYFSKEQVWKQISAILKLPRPYGMSKGPDPDILG